MEQQRWSRRTVLHAGGAAAVTAALGVRPAAAATTRRFYLGTLTTTGGPGIVRGTANTTTGALQAAVATKALVDPSWLAFANGVLYAVSEKITNGTVSALRPDTLAVRNTVVSGGRPAHIAVHPGGKHLFSSLYKGGATVTHPITATGTVGAASDTRLQASDTQASHAHHVVVDPSGAFVLSVDLGRDSVFVYQLNASAGKLSLVRRTALAAGSGPRHLVFHPTRAFAYVANELNGTVTVCSWAGGVLTPGQVLAAAPASGVANAPAEIVVSADGKFLYVSNRGPNTVSVFSVSTDGSHLTRIANRPCGGDWPRHIAIEPVGKRLYVCNQRSGTVTWMPINPTTGIPGAVAGSFAAPGASHLLFA